MSYWQPKRMSRPWKGCRPCTQTRHLLLVQDKGHKRTANHYRQCHLAGKTHNTGSETSKSSSWLRDTEKCDDCTPILKNGT